MFRQSTHNVQLGLTIRGGRGGWGYNVIHNVGNQGRGVSFRLTPIHPRHFEWNCPDTDGAGLLKLLSSSSDKLIRGILLCRIVHCKKYMMNGNAVHHTLQIR